MILYTLVIAILFRELSYMKRESKNLYILVIDEVVAVTFSLVFFTIKMKYYVT